MSAFRTLDDAGSLTGKRVLMRVDLNVPMENGRVTDATRIERVVPTIREVAAQGAKVILLAHFGRPKGKREPKDSLEPVVPALSAALGRDVAFAADCVGDAQSVTQPAVPLPGGRDTEQLVGVAAAAPGLRVRENRCALKAGGRVYSSKSSSARRGGCQSCCSARSYCGGAGQRGSPR